MLTVAIASSRVSQWLRVPAPAFFLLGASLVASFVPGVGAPSIGTVDRIVTVALVLILFDGGMHIGLRRIRSVLGSLAGFDVLAAADAGGELGIMIETSAGLVRKTNVP